MVFPVSSHWVLSPVAQAASEALPEALRQAGYEAQAARPDSPFVQLAVQDGWLTGPETAADGLVANRYLLGLLARAEAALTGTVSAADQEAALEVELAGTIAQRPAKIRVVAARQDDAAKVGRELAGKVAAAVTGEVWGELGTDPAGRKAGAAARFAAGAAVRATDYRAAAVEYEAAIAGDPENVEYLMASAVTLMRWGDSGRAFTRLQAARRLAGEDLELKGRIAQETLNAGHPAEAEAVFLELVAAKPEDPVALEGVGNAARDRGDLARAEEYYRRAIACYPQLKDEPSSLPATMAHLRDRGLRLASVRPGSLMFVLAVIYFRGGEEGPGVRALSVYHQAAEREPYDDGYYLVLAQGLDEEMERIAREVEEALRGPRSTADEIEEIERIVDGLHDRSERLADLGDRISTSGRADTAHRFRALSYHALNESNFEALTYARTNDESHRRRSALLRDAARRAMGEAQDLAPARGDEEAAE